MFAWLGVALRAGTSDLVVIGLAAHLPSSSRLVAGLAKIAGLNMIRGFASGGAAIMARHAIIGDTDVAEARACKRCGGVAGSAISAGGDMTRGLTSGFHTVVA